MSATKYQTTFIAEEQKQLPKLDFDASVYFSSHFGDIVETIFHDAHLEMHCLETETGKS
jgi:hypothetical protein